MKNYHDAFCEINGTILYSDTFEYKYANYLKV